MSFLSPATTAHGRKQRQASIRRHADTMASTAEMRANLLAALADADTATVREGAAWYLTAHSAAADLATTYGFTVRQTAGVLAAFSPRTGWADNVALATDACRHAANGRSDLIGGTMTDHVKKASMILRGADPFDVLGGRKVRSFFSNILRPMSYGPVTVDRHAVDMLAGRRGAHGDRFLESNGVYVRCAAVIRSVARDVGMRPHEVQAIAWVHWRKLHDVAYRFDLPNDGTAF